MSSVVMLGGTGWVGRHTCEAFAARGYSVTTVARNPAACISMDLTKASVTTMAALLRSRRADVVVNATDSDRPDRTETEHEAVNVSMVSRLVEAVGTLPWRARLVHLGTIHEYGPVPWGTAIAETTPTNPVNVYSRSKLGGSGAVLAATRSGAIDGVVLRLVNLFGPHPTPHTFPGKLLALLRTVAPTLTIAPARRDFVDVRDVAGAILAAATGPGALYNIGSGNAVEIRTMVEVLLAEAGLAPSALAVHNGQVESVGGNWIQADITQAVKHLSWQPVYSLNESLRDMWHAT